MKTNVYILIIEAMLAFIITAGVTLGDMFNLQGLLCWVLSFCFWFLILLPMWGFKKKNISRGR